MTGYKARRRERIWDAACVDCDGHSAKQPDCNICGLPVLAGDAWDISHMPAPAAFGGERVGVAHRACNRRHNNETVTPMAAKARRQRLKHNGVVRLGIGRHPMPCGRNSPWRKRMNGQVVLR